MNKDKNTTLWGWITGIGLLLFCIGTQFDADPESTPMWATFAQWAGGAFGGLGAILQGIVSKDK
jgi:hypothetical protein